MAKGEVRRRMVATAARLLAENGPGGASFGDVLKASGASRGSTYHHFPDGKREMYPAALDLASGRAFAALEGVRGRSAAEVVEAFFAMWRGLLTTTDLRLGCAVLAVAVAGEDSDSIAHSGHVFAPGAHSCSRSSSRVGPPRTGHTLWRLSRSHPPKVRWPSLGPRSPSQASSSSRPRWLIWRGQSTDLQTVFPWGHQTDHGRPGFGTPSARRAGPAHPCTTRRYGA